MILCTNTLRRLMAAPRRVNQATVLSNNGRDVPWACPGPAATAHGGGNGSARRRNNPARGEQHRQPFAGHGSAVAGDVDFDGDGHCETSRLGRVRGTTVDPAK